MLPWKILHLKRVFLGCLTTDPLLFVWDQYLITSDVPKFHDEFIPAIATAMIITLRDFLMKCRSVCSFVIKEKIKFSFLFVN